MLQNPLLHEPSLPHSLGIHQKAIQDSHTTPGTIHASQHPAYPSQSFVSTKAPPQLTWKIQPRQTPPRSFLARDEAAVCVFRSVLQRRRPWCRWRLRGMRGRVPTLCRILGLCGSRRRIVQLGRAGVVITFVKWFGTMWQQRKMNEDTHQSKMTAWDFAQITFVYLIGIRTRNHCKLNDSTD